MAEQEYILEMRNVSKTFPGVKALSGIDFNLKKGEVHAIAGENGAGKSTLIKILSGVYQPDDGAEIKLDGKKISKLNPQIAAEKGIQTIFQENTLVPDLTVTENLFLGMSDVKKTFISWKELKNKATEFLKILNLDIAPDKCARDLGIAEQQCIQITRAIARKGRILIMDEPTASFGIEETDRLLEIVDTLRKHGEAIIYISHHLDEVLKIADRVTVIRDGQKISTHDVAELTHDKMVSEMVGRDVGFIFDKEKVEIGKEILKVNNITKKNVIENIKFSIHEGEILGVYGLVGAGRTEMAMTLMGALTADIYDAEIKGHKMKVKNTKDAINYGIGMITEDRRKTGLVIDATIKDNILLAGFNKLPGFFLKRAEEEKVSQKYVEDLDIKTPTVYRQVQFLSGGNQQKVVLAKWIYADKDVIIFDEPTRGVDIGAKEEIYKIITSLAKQGKAILLITSEMPELVSLSYRVLVKKEGRIKAELKKDSIEEETILSYAIGGTKQ